jgi:diguanylate cyclase (GGDEF)-like protein
MSGSDGMNSILSITTIMVCTSITTTIVAIALTCVLLFTDNREKATAWWCASMWSATICGALLASRTVSPQWFGVGLGNAFGTLAFGMIWAGFTAFAGRIPSRLFIVAGSLAWLGCFYGIEMFREDINLRFILVSVINCVYGLLVVKGAWRGWKDERLPSFLATSVFFSLHSVAYGARIPLAIFAPAIERGGVIYAPWISIVAIEAYTLTIFSAFIFTSLIKERAERRYRLAAEIDSLTSVSTRRHFVECAREALGRKPDSAFLAILDLDFFKKINDTYGHMAGDRVLQAFSRDVLAQIGPNMHLGRLGGEEFGLLITNMTDTAAMEAMETLRARVEALHIPFNGHVLRVTTSIGVAGSEEAGFDFDHLTAGADNALYLAKQDGRNCVSRFMPAMRLRDIVEDGRDTRVSLTNRRISRISVRSRLGRQ